MANFVISNRKPKCSRRDLDHVKTNTVTPSGALKSNTNGFHRERERGRRKRSHQKEFLDVSGRGKMHCRSKPASHLIGQGKARGKIPMEQTLHHPELEGSPWGLVGGGGGGRAIFPASNHTAFTLSLNYLEFLWYIKDLQQVDGMSSNHLMISRFG